MIWLFIILALLLVLGLYLRKSKKEPKLADLTLVTGGVKAGKSSLSLYLAYRRYKRELRKWCFKCFFCSKLCKPYPEKPLFYSNIPVGFPFVPLTRNIILRKERVAFKSVCFVDEASLLADGFDFKDDVVNEQIKLFNKLWGHESHGGYLVYNTQNPKDLHFNIKRCLNTYLWVHHCYKRIPFFLVFKVREMYYADDGVANVFNEDVEDTLKWVVCSKRIWKKFDCYCYSQYTDSLHTDTGEQKATTLKADIVTFKPSTLLEKGATLLEKGATLLEKGE